MRAGDVTPSTAGPFARGVLRKRRSGGAVSTALPCRRGGLTACLEGICSVAGFVLVPASAPFRLALLMPRPFFHSRPRSTSEAPPAHTIGLSVRRALGLTAGAIAVGLIIAAFMGRTSSSGLARVWTFAGRTSFVQDLRTGGAPGRAATPPREPAAALAGADSVAGDGDRADGRAAAIADSLAQLEAARIRARAPLRLDVNLPAYEVVAWQGDSQIVRFGVAIGAPRYRTPRGRFVMRSVVWNPWWHPPKEEWAAKDSATPPGPRNPMGRVKLNIHELLYFHGTPARTSIGSAASHGCLRMRSEEAQALAALVHRLAGPALPDSELIRRLANVRRTRQATLATPVSVVLRYDPIVRRGDTLVFYPDVYALETDSSRVARLDSLLTPTERLGVEGDSILRLPGVARALRWAERKRVRLAVRDVGRAAALPVPPRPRPTPPNAPASTIARPAGPDSVTGGPGTQDPIRPVAPPRDTVAPPSRVPPPVIGPPAPPPGT